MVDISIIIPIFNVEQYLEDCINSVVNQTKQEIEIILIDDGSTDSSGHICDEYAKKDNRIKVIHKKNEGAGLARNEGMRVSQGEYFAFVDGDDLLPEYSLEHSFHLIKSNSADLVYFDFCYVHHREFHEVLQPIEKIEFLDNLKTMEYFFRGIISATPCSKLYKRSLWNNIVFPNKAKHEDAYILHEVLANSKKTVITNQKLYIQYLRSGSAMQSPFTKDNLVCIECGERYISFCEQFYPSLGKYAEINLLERQVWMLSKIKHDKVKHVYKHIYKSLLLDMANTIKNKKYLFNINKEIYLSAKNQLFPYTIYNRVHLCLKNILNFPYKVTKKMQNKFQD